MRIQDMVKQLGKAHRESFEELAKQQPALAELDIKGLNALQAAQPGELTFVAQPVALKALPQCKASAVLLRPEWVAQCPAHIQPWPVPHPALMMAHLSALFALPLRDVEGADPVIGEGSFIDAQVSLGKGVQIGKAVTLFPGVVIGDGVSIGDRTVLHPNVTVYRDCHIGSDCIVHAGSVIGSDGFGYVADADGKRVKLHQLGNVVIEGDVEVGANCAIDRATFGTTLIHRGVKIDNLVQIGHNADIGDNTVICGQVGFAGSMTVGKGVTVGAQSGMAGHLKVADGITFAARSGVTKSIKKPGGIYSGFPAQPHAHWLKEQVSLRRLLAKLGRGEGQD